MNDQMEQVWRSKAGKCVGSKKEVEAYLATLSPLGGMRFPYVVFDDAVFWTEGHYSERVTSKDAKALVAFANLAPLIEKWSEGRSKRVMDSAESSLLFAYEEALKLVPR